MADSEMSEGGAAGTSDDSIANEMFSLVEVTIEVAAKEQP